jgi:hypothetical protein
LHTTAPDLPEALTEGKEGLYIKSFYDRLVSHLSPPCLPGVRKSIQSDRASLIIPLDILPVQTSKPDFLTPSDQAEYTAAFSAPGRMKAGFEVYRAFRKDCKDVQREIGERGKLGREVPVLASGGEKSPLSEVSLGSGCCRVGLRDPDKILHFLGGTGRYTLARSWDDARVGGECHFRARPR